MGRMYTAWALCAVLLSSSVVEAQALEITSKEADVKSRPKDSSAHTALGLAYLEAGRFRDATRTLEKAESLSKGNPEAVVRLAQVHIAQGDQKGAQKRCKKLFPEKGDAPAIAHVCMARAYLAWNRAERAFEELDQAAAKDDGLREVDLVRGHAHRLRNEVAEAEAAYARAKGEPRCAAEADLGLGRLYASAGRKDDAIAALRRALASAPRSPDALYELGLLLGASAEARQLLAAAADNRPGWAEAARALGDARRDAGDLGGAAAAYRRALEIDAQLARAHAGLGEVLMLSGDLVEAQLSLERALALFPNDARSVLAMAELLSRQGHFEEAVEQFRHAADLDPRSPVALTRAAELLYQQNRMTMAAGYLDRLLQNHPKNGHGLALYGDVMKASGNKVEAKAYYERALSAGSVDRAAVEGKLRGL
jgi:protein O-GlcNAc transferase